MSDNPPIRRNPTSREILLGQSPIRRPNLESATPNSHVMRERAPAPRPDYRYTNAYPQSPDARLERRKEISKAIIKFRAKGGVKKVCPKAGNPYIAYNVHKLY